MGTTATCVAALSAGTPSATADAGVDPGGFVLYPPKGSTTTYLLDTSGTVAHRWESQFKVGQSAFLEKDGSIVRLGYREDGNRFANEVATPTGFNTGGVIERIGPDGDVRWRYRLGGNTRMSHHMAKPLPSGNVLVPVWRHATRAEAIGAGRRPENVPRGGLWFDSVVEVAPTGARSGRIVWEWRTIDHLVQDEFPRRNNFGSVRRHPERIDVNSANETVLGDVNPFHINAVEYIPEHDQVVISSGTYDEVWVVDHSTTRSESRGSTGGRSAKGGDLLYRWGSPRNYGHRGPRAQLSPGHDVQWHAATRTLSIYDNSGESGTRQEGAASRVIRIAPPLRRDGTYARKARAPFGPKRPVWAAQLPGHQRALGTAQRVEGGPLGGGAFSCLCLDGTAVWFDRRGRIAKTLALEIDGSQAAAFQIQHYVGSHPGVQRVLSLAGPRHGRVESS